VIMQTLLWLAVVALATIGTALVFIGVTIPPAFLPGIVIIDCAVVIAAGAGLLELRTSSPSDR